MEASPGTWRHSHPAICSADQHRPAWPSAGRVERPLGGASLDWPRPALVGGRMGRRGSLAVLAAIGAVSRETVEGDRPAATAGPILWRRSRGIFSSRSLPLIYSGDRVWGERAEAAPSTGADGRGALRSRVLAQSSWTAALHASVSRSHFVERAKARGHTPTPPQSFDHL